MCFIRYVEVKDLCDCVKYSVFVQKVREIMRKIMLRLWFWAACFYSYLARIYINIYIYKCTWHWPKRLEHMAMTNSFKLVCKFTLNLLKRLCSFLSVTHKGHDLHRVWQQKSQKAERTFDRALAGCRQQPAKKRDTSKKHKWSFKETRSGGSKWVRVQQET